MVFTGRLGRTETFSSPALIMTSRDRVRGWSPVSTWIALLTRVVFALNPDGRRAIRHRTEAVRLVIPHLRLGADTEASSKAVGKWTRTS